MEQEELKPEPQEAIHWPKHHRRKRKGRITCTVRVAIPRVIKRKKKVVVNRWWRAAPYVL